MVYWVEFGNGFRERGYDTIVKTRRYAKDILENTSWTHADIYASKDAMVMEGVISRYGKGFKYFSKKSKRWYLIRKNGTLVGM